MDEKTKETVKDFVSIIINVQKLHGLQACLKSILCQTYGDLEILVEDDSGSSEMVNQIIADFCDCRIKVLEKIQADFEERNLAYAAGAKGEYVMYMTEDMVLNKDYLRSMLAWRKEGVQEVLPEYGFLDSDGNKYYASPIKRIEMAKNRKGIRMPGVIQRNNPDILRGYFRGRSCADSVKSITCECFLRIEDDACQTMQAWDNRLEIIKDKILDSDAVVISFDMFDTLVVRPFSDPLDLLQLLDFKFEKLMKTNISFQKLRIDAEAYLRDKIHKKEIYREDITLAEIYAAIEKLYGIEKKICSYMYEEERELERKFCKRRQVGKELFDLARFLGKRIIIVSDMYLEEDEMAAILNDCGYEGYEKIFVSSAYGKLKETGKLYEAVLSELKIEPDAILHIGDHWVKDCVMAQEKGLRTVHLPKALDVFLNQDDQYGTRICGHFAEQICSNLVDYEEVQKSIGFQCMMAIVANRYFDHPFRNFWKSSDFNQDPYLTGFYTVGMYMLGMLQWLVEIIKKRHYTRIIFSARDGWLMMQVYELYRKYHTQLPESEYRYISRKAVLPAMISNTLDLYDLPISKLQYTPEKLSELLAFCFKDDSKKELKKEVQKLCQEVPIGYRDPFDEVSYLRWIRLFIERLYDKERHRKAMVPIRAYFEDLSESAVIFDMGYSGRIQNAICQVTGKKINAIYVHSDACKHNAMMQKGGYETDCFYDFNPYMYDALREYILSDTGASCCGYERKEGKAIPVFAKKPEEAFVTIADGMQHGALDFVREYFSYFHEYEEYITYKSHEVGMPFEAFLRYCGETDRRMFELVEFDDEVYGGSSQLNMKEMVEARLKWLPTYAK